MKLSLIYDCKNTFGKPAHHPTIATKNIATIIINKVPPFYISYSNVYNLPLLSKTTTSFYTHYHLRCAYTTNAQSPTTPVAVGD